MGGEGKILHLLYRVILFAPPKSHNFHLCRLHWNECVTCECTVHPCGRPRELSPFSPSQPPPPHFGVRRGRCVLCAGSFPVGGFPRRVFEAAFHKRAEGQNSRKRSWTRLKGTLALSHLTTLCANIKKIKEINVHTHRHARRTGACTAQKWLSAEEATLPSDV